MPISVHGHVHSLSISGATDVDTLRNFNSLFNLSTCESVIVLKDTFLEFQKKLESNSANYMRSIHFNCAR